MKDFIDGQTNISKILEKLNTPLDIRVEADHPLLMPDPLDNKDNYLPLQTDRLETGNRVESLRVKDNALVREVLSSGTLNILDERIKFSAIGGVESGLVGQGKNLW